ncbi:ABC transporter ATP-binding protein [Nocardioides sp.]|uniref:ABC transporter ATP-binding protein n=1 Tax=Nocardioides sp. TaxID=35761 RepID=UPI002634DA64|nr:ATP-binding cassette domain-containing protein [Nocardioides sp.]
MTDLELRGVRYELTRTLLHDLDLTFRAGRMTALSGPSGSGKTTLLSIAGGLLQPSLGEATYAGEPMWRGTGDPRPEVAFVLQVYGLVPILSARENVSVALRARGVDPDEADERASAALARFHIGDLGDRQVEELSGGQMQRVALARGLCVDAAVLLADEPTSELDEGNRALVLAELRREADRGAVVVVATHDPAVVDACDDHHALDEGRLVDHTEPVHLGGGRHRAAEGASAAGTSPAGRGASAASQETPPQPIQPVAPVPATAPAPAAPPAPAPPAPGPPSVPPIDPDDDPHRIYRRPGSA